MGVDVCGFCGRQFEFPVRLTNLSGGPEETYSACPFCFSRVEKARAEAALGFVARKKQEKVGGKEMVEAIAPSAKGCGHHLGYLKGRGKNAAVPDECLVCPKILECMI